MKFVSKSVDMDRKHGTQCSSNFLQSDEASNIDLLFDSCGSPLPSSPFMPLKSRISFSLNSMPVTVDHPCPSLSLADFIRNSAGLTGTKVSCRQGGCGACTVLLDGKAVNSCLKPLCAVDGCQVLTVEAVAGLGCEVNLDGEIGAEDSDGDGDDGCDGDKCKVASGVAGSCAASSCKAKGKEAAAHGQRWGERGVGAGGGGGRGGGGGSEEANGTTRDEERGMAGETAAEAGSERAGVSGGKGRRGCVEQTGGQLAGGKLHPVQKQLVQHHGTQCGFCTPGFVVNMVSLLQSNQHPSPLDIDSHFDGNLCRCTGYRPILDAFQKFAAPPAADSGGSSCRGEGAGRDDCRSEGRLQDIEDLNSMWVKCQGNKTNNAVLCSTGDTTTWVSPLSLDQLLTLMQQARAAKKTFRLVVGNTSTGIYRPPPAALLVDISRIPELTMAAVDDESGIIIGGAVTITALMQLLQQHGERSSSYGPLLLHLKRVATHQVRNIASVAGNLVLSNYHADFPSDLATILWAAGAKLRILQQRGMTASEEGEKGESRRCASGIAASIAGDTGKAGLQKNEDLEDWEQGEVDVAQFLELDCSHLVVLSIQLPPFRSNEKLLTYKVAQRRVNSHAIVNAAFRFEISECGSLLSAPLLVFGGLSAHPWAASLTAKLLSGTRPEEVIQPALLCLASELTNRPSSPLASYQSSLATTFLYKALLSLMPPALLPPDLLSTTLPYSRPVSKGRLQFPEPDPSVSPISQPLPKLSAAIQTTGAALYLDDLPPAASQLYAAFVLSSEANADIAAIDAQEALTMPGITHFLSAATLKAHGFCNWLSEHEELFASHSVSFHGQPIGLIVATSQMAAAAASEVVHVSYCNVRPPVLTIQDAAKQGSFFDDTKIEIKRGSFQEAASEADMVIEGETSLGHQYHFHLETQRASAVPAEDGALTIYSSTQNPALIQQVVSSAVNIPQHKVEVIVHRVGGAYGAKINRSAPAAMAAAVAATMAGTPVKLLLDLSTNMRMVGGRSPYHAAYKIALTKEGKVRGIFLRVLNNHGAHFDVDYPDLSAFFSAIDNVYDVPHWDAEAICLRTNLPASTWIRGPGIVEGVFVAESIMEHAAAALSLPPLQLKLLNMYHKGGVTPTGQSLPFCNAREVLETARLQSSFDSRLAAVASFNASSRWVKRGLSINPVKYNLQWQGTAFSAMIGIFPDASIEVSQAGCEIGQGLHVKVAQVVSNALGSLTSDGIPLCLIKLSNTSTAVAINATSTGGSVTSELCCMAAKEASSILLSRLQPIASLLATQQQQHSHLTSSSNSSQCAAISSGCSLPSWQQLVHAAFDAGVDLQARARVSPPDSGHGPFQYVSFGAGVTEAEVDLLTGDTRLRYCHLLLDCGRSINPAIDVGQVQGAYVMGLGNFMTEDLLYDAASGKLLSNSTWEYKPPSHVDIPEEFNVSLMANSGNPFGFLRSKASGEPPYAMACSALFAVQQALMAGKKEVGRRAKVGEEGSLWVPLHAPATVQKVSLAANVPLNLLIA